METKKKKNVCGVVKRMKFSTYLFSIISYMKKKALGVLSSNFKKIF